MRDSEPKVSDDDLREYAAWHDAGLESYEKLIRTLARDLLRAREQLQAAQRDAARYKYLRDNLGCRDLPNNAALHSREGLGFALSWQDALDRQVDAAIAAMLPPAPPLPAREKEDGNG